MPTVIPIEPALRRRDASRPARPLERSVPIRLHVEATPAPRAAVALAAEAGLTDRALAARFFPLVAAVVALDLATKAWAVASLATRSLSVAPGVSLSLAFNHASAGGVSLGANTRSINFMATGLVVGMMVMLAPMLTRLDRRAWRALALIAGAGLGNMASLAAGGAGVPDFIALHRAGGGAWVLNVADVVLALGLALLARTVITLAGAARQEGHRVVLH